MPRASSGSLAWPIRHEDNERIPVRPRFRCRERPRRNQNAVKLCAKPRRPTRAIRSVSGYGTGSGTKRSKQGLARRRQIGSG